MDTARESRVFEMTLPARLDHCMFGLQHPETDDAMQRKTRVQTSSREMCSALDQRVCEYQHKDTPTAGSCKIQNHRSLNMQASIPGHLPAIVKGILKTKHGPIEAPAYHVDEHVEL